MSSSYQIVVSNLHCLDIPTDSVENAGRRSSTFVPHGLDFSIEKRLLFEQELFLKGHISHFLWFLPGLVMIAAREKVSQTLEGRSILHHWLLLLAVRGGVHNGLFD